MNSWIQDYLTLCFQVDAALRRQGMEMFIDYYYGPAEVKEATLAGEELSLQEAKGRAEKLLERLPAQGFEAQRSAYLEKQAVALRTFARVFSGEELSLDERVRGCLDVSPVIKPLEDVQQAMRLLDAALPPGGDLRQRAGEWRQRNELPLERSAQVIPLMERVLEEARRRARAFTPLPAEESLELHTITDKVYSAANWYLGGYRSRLELNVNRPVNVFALLYQMCHEGYPGHHTESTLKEAHLYRQLGREENTLAILSPQLVISEGIATLAFETIFSYEEAAAWVTENLYRPLGIRVDDADLATLYHAFSLSRSDDLGSNVAVLMEQGWSDDQLVEYSLAYSFYPESQVRPWVASLRDPLAQIYAFSYYQGARLMQPRLQGPDRLEVFRSFLMDQITPSMLEAA